MPNYKSRSDLGTTWNPKKDEAGNPRYVATEDDYIEGVYVDRKDNIGQYNSTVYNIEKPDGSIIAVWGDTVLDKEMDKYKFREFIKIKFEGRALKKDVKAGSAFTDKNSFWTWKVYVDESYTPGASASAESAHDSIQPPVISNSDSLPF